MKRRVEMFDQLVFNYYYARGTRRWIHVLCNDEQLSSNHMRNRLHSSHIPYPRE